MTNTHNPKPLEINFKSFTLKQFKAVYKGLKFMIEPTIDEDILLTISEHFFSDNISKGSENLYFDFIVHEANPESVTEYKFAIYTKDQHELLKSLIIDIIKQA